jgi:hypothetical protein
LTKKDFNGKIREKELIMIKKIILNIITSSALTGFVYIMNPEIPLIRGVMLFIVLFSVYFVILSMPTKESNINEYIEYNYLKKKLDNYKEENNYEN